MAPHQRNPRDADEGNKERVDRELIELLNELRVALPGVQVLFAFLLTVPFAQCFEVLDATDRGVYFGAVVASAVASALLIAPSAHHRLRFRAGSKERMLKVANALAVAGMLALAIGAVMYVIASVLYESSAAALIAAAFTAGIAALWFVLPLTHPTDDDASGAPTTDGGRARVPVGTP